jgi:hypothetical protein
VSYRVKSFATRSFWKFAVFSTGALGQLLAAIGGIYLFMEIMDFLGIYKKDHYSKYAILPIMVVSLLYVVFTRRPLTRTKYKLPQKDCTIEVKIGDLFSEEGDIVISTNTTFDTDLSSGLIADDSLQGQMALRVFKGKTEEIDRQIAKELAHAAHKDRPSAPGKKREYPIGTVAKVTTAERNFYLVAMATLNDQGTASSTLRGIEDALSQLWQFVADRGEMRTLVVPLMGTGRGRLEMPRKKIVERIAQSFVYALKDKLFSNKLKIIVRPEDAESFSINLFEVRDYLVKSLHT